MKQGREEPQHYFVREPAVASAPVTFKARVRGFVFHLTSDRGVFSHGRVDAGTRLLANALVVPPRSRVLDLGCGWGVLGILAARLCPECKVTLVDVNDRAAGLAAANAEANDAGRVEVASGDAREVLAGRRFDLVVTNPPCRSGRKTVLGLFEWAASVLSPEGALWAVIQTNKGAKRYAGDLLEWFEEVETARMLHGYRVLRASRPRLGLAAGGAPEPPEGGGSAEGQAGSTSGG